MKMKLSVFLFLSIFFISSYKIHSADRDKFNYNYNLYEAIRYQEIENFLWFLNNGVSIKWGMSLYFYGSYKRSLLSWATYLGRLDIVELLIMRGAEVDMKDSDGSTPLRRAICDGHIEIVRLLLQNKANPNTKNDWMNYSIGEIESNDTPLLAAVRSNACELVKLLLTNKAIIEGHEREYAKSPEIKKLLGGSSCVVQ